MALVHSEADGLSVPAEQTDKPVRARHTPGPEGEADIRNLGLSYYYDPDDWEVTVTADDPWVAGEWISEHNAAAPIMRIATLIEGPELFVASLVDESGGDDVRFFATEADARAAIAKALGTEA